MYLQMAQCARRNANVLLTGEVTGKNVTGTVKVFKKKINKFKDTQNSNISVRRLGSSAQLAR